MNPQLTACLFPACLVNTGFSAFNGIRQLGDNATQSLARLVGRPALSRLLAGMSLPRRCFAQTIPSKRTNDRIQLRSQG